MMEASRLEELAVLSDELARTIPEDVKTATDWLHRAKSLVEATLDGGHARRDLKDSVLLEDLGPLVSALEAFGKEFAGGFSLSKRTRFVEFLGRISRGLRAGQASKRSPWWLQDPDAERDAVAGVAERKAFDRDLVRACGEAAADAPLAILLFDLDHFKNVNDQHGHQVGDEVLGMVGQTLGRLAAHRGKAYRYGGEELVLLLVNCAEDEAVALAERCRLALSRSSFSVKGLHVTASVGVAVHPSDACATPEQAVAAADAALYQAKKGGRDRVCSAMRRPAAASGATPGAQLANAGLSNGDRRILLADSLQWRSDLTAVVDLEATSAKLGCDQGTVYSLLREMENAEEIEIAESGSKLVRIRKVTVRARVV